MIFKQVRQQSACIEGGNKERCYATIRGRNAIAVGCPPDKNEKGLTRDDLGKHNSRQSLEESRKALILRPHAAEPGSLTEP